MEFIFSSVGPVTNELTHSGLMMLLFNIGSRNVLLPDGTKS